MNEITAITPQVKDKTRCNIFIDGRFCCGLSLETAVKNRLKVGQCVSPETLSALQLDSEKQKALDKALLHISATRKTEKQIRDFLAKQGYLGDVCDYVVEKMRSYAFIDDDEYAKAYTECARGKKGGRLIEMELKAKGVSPEVAEKAVAEIDEQSELQVALCILEKYMRAKTADRQTLYKAFRYLMGKGFSYETAKSALAKWGELED